MVGTDLSSELRRWRLSRLELDLACSRVNWVAGCIDGCPSIVGCCRVGLNGPAVDYAMRFVSRFGFYWADGYGRVIYTRHAMFLADPHKTQYEK